LRVAKNLSLLCLLAAMTVTAAQTQSSSQPLTNAEVIGLVQAGLDTDLIMQKIRTAQAKSFDTSVDGLKALNEAKVPQEVIRFMITGKEPKSPTAPADANAKTDGAATSGQAKSDNFKDGLWEVHATKITSSSMSSEQKSDEISQLCRDQRDSVATKVNAMMGQPHEAGCLPSISRPEPGMAIVTLQCTQVTNDSSVKSSMKITFRQLNEEHSQIETKSQMSGTLGGRLVTMDSTSIQDMTYKGPSCPIDMHPGDEKKKDGTITQSHM
jgi:hypothetical protein